MKSIVVTLFNLAFILAITSCNEDPYLPKYENEDLTDSTGAVWALDLFLKGDLDGDEFSYQNNREDYLNYCMSTKNGYCDSLIWAAPGDRSFINVETMIFQRFNDSNNIFYIDKIDCMLYDTNWEYRNDSMFVIGDYDYLSLTDSVGGIQVRYIDGEGKLWSTSFGANDLSTSEFKISAVVENDADTVSQYVAFGKFSCKLYDEDGFYLDLDNAEFKSRFGVYNN